MTNAKHTPGRWTSNGNQIYSAHMDEDGAHETLICEIYAQHDWWRSNADLIKTAPVLLQFAKHELPMLKELKKYITDGNPDDVRAAEIQLHIKICEAIIATAEGR